MNTWNGLSSPFQSTAFGEWYLVHTGGKNDQPSRQCSLVVTIDKILLNLIICLWKLARETWLDKKWAICRVFRGGAKFHFRSARKYTKYFPFTDGLLCVCFGLRSSFLLEDARGNYMQQFCVARARLGIWEGSFNILPIPLLKEELGLPKLWNIRRRHRSQGVEELREVVKNQLVPHPQSRPDHLPCEVRMIGEVVT